MPYKVSNIYKQNNLFYVIMYDFMHQRRYVRDVPGSDMCGSAKNISYSMIVLNHRKTKQNIQMAVVTWANCTEIDEIEAN